VEIVRAVSARYRGFRGLRNQACGAPSRGRGTEPIEPFAAARESKAAAGEGRRWDAAESSRQATVPM